jgi:hypothetical protein
MTTVSRIKKSSAFRSECTRLSPLQDETVDFIKNRFSGKNIDQYIEFMKKIGFGVVGDSEFAIFEGFMEASDLGLPQEYENNILFFGSNYGESNFGFDKNNGFNITLVSSEGGEPEYISKDFFHFMSDVFGLI